MRKGFKLYQTAGKFAVMLTLAGVISAPAAFGQANTNRGNVLFTQQDRVIAFGQDGAGKQVGTVTGKINGTSIVNFQFTFVTEFTITFHNTVVLTDLDGDQIKFINDGSGSFVAPIDPAFFLGGPLVGTYEVMSGTGKYVSWVGKKFPYRAVASNPPPPDLGTVYVEVYSNPIK